MRGPQGQAWTYMNAHVASTGRAVCVATAPHAISKAEPGSTQLTHWQASHHPVCQAKSNRQYLDSNQGGKFPTDFESVALTTRPHCRDDSAIGDVAYIMLVHLRWCPPAIHSCSCSNTAVILQVWHMVRAAVYGIAPCP